MSVIYQRRAVPPDINSQWISGEFALVQRSLSLFYDEGTWTPVPVGATVTGTQTYIGSYTRIGRVVHWGLGIINSGGGTFASTSGTTQLSGFPIRAGGDYISTIQDSTRAVLGQSVVQVNSGLTVIYFPTFAANGNFISASGWFNM